VRSVMIGTVPCDLGGVYEPHEVAAAVLGQVPAR
jgi:hypothetical protein